MDGLRPIYLDHNATTPLDPEVFEAMVPFFVEKFGNPSSVEHVYGSEASSAVERAREQVANTIGARPSEIIFTGSCTEATNLAILGIVRASLDKRHLVTSAIEHPAVLETFRSLEADGYQVTYVGVDEHGRVDPAAVAKALTNKTALVSVMSGNNEVGTLQPIREIGALCADRGIPLHSDLAQTIAYAPTNVSDDHVHLASLSAHKAYGPKGIGALYVRSKAPRIKLGPVIFGGGQERGLRPGTLNAPLIVGMGEAFVKAKKTATSTSERLRSLCRTLHQRIAASVDGVLLNGHPSERLPNNLSLSIPGVEPLALIRLLRDSVCFSASSACATNEVRSSHVLLAMFGDVWRARGAFRLAPGRFTAACEVDRAAEAIIVTVQQLQRRIAGRGSQRASAR